MTTSDGTSGGVVSGARGTSSFWIGALWSDVTTLAAGTAAICIWGVAESGRDGAEIRVG